MLNNETLKYLLPNDVTWERTIDVRVNNRYLVGALDTVQTELNKRAPPPQDFDDKLWVLALYDNDSDSRWAMDLILILSNHIGVVSGWSFDAVEPFVEGSATGVLLRLKMATLYDMAR